MLCYIILYILYIYILYPDRCAGVPPPGFPYLGPSFFISSNLISNLISNVMSNLVSQAGMLSFLRKDPGQNAGLFLVAVLGLTVRILVFYMLKTGRNAGLF